MASNGSVRRVLVYVAASLDGRIANGAGSVDWLNNPHDGSGEDYGYAKFLGRVSTILMGRKTYEDIIGFSCDYPYKQFENIVYTRNPSYSGKHPKTEGVDLKVITDSLITHVGGLKAQGPAESIIYANGGGEIFSELLRGRLIDEIILTIHPSIQGDGPLLFPGQSRLANLNLLSHRAWPSGLVQLHYEVTYEKTDEGNLPRK